MNNDIFLEYIIFRECMIFIIEYMNMFDGIVLKYKIFEG